MNGNEILKKYYKYIPFLILFLVLILWHYGFRFKLDDLYFQRLLSTTPLFSLDSNNFLVMRYLTWSSRSLIELNFSIFVLLSDFGWKLANSIIFIIIALLIAKLSIDTTQLSEEDTVILYALSCIFISLFFLVYKEILDSAGWVATLTNYIWPCCFALLHFYILRNYNLKNSSDYGFRLNLISIILLFEAASFEQLLGVITLIYLLIFAYLIYNHVKIPKILYGYVSAIIFNLIYVLVCPGNSLRMETAVEELFPNFPNLTLINKLDFGFNAFLNGCITRPTMITLIFFAIFGVYCYYTLKKRKISLLSFVPFGIAFFFFIYQFFGLSILPDWIFLSQDNIFSMNLKFKIIIILLNLVIVFTMLISLYLVYKYDKFSNSSIILFVLITICIISAGITGFTPTFTSLDRAYLVSYLIIIICSMIMLKDLFYKKVFD